MRDYDYNYKSESFNKKVEQFSELPIYEVFNVNLNKFNDNKTIFFEELCFLISMSGNYSHSLLDGIGAYYQLKKMYPDLIPIFIDEARKPALKEYKSVALKEFAIKNNFQIIDLNKNNYFFKKIITHNYYFSPIPIESLQDEVIQENDDSRQIKFYQNSVKEVLKNINYKNTYSDKKIYISRRFANYDRKHHKNKHIAQNFTYDERYDDILESFFSSVGFEILELESYSFQEQINIFSESNIVVSIEGTGLMNCIWMNKNSKIFNIKIYETFFPWEKIINQDNDKIMITSNISKLKIKDGIDNTISMFNELF
jgi:hypothetical protein